MESAALIVTLVVISVLSLAIASCGWVGKQVAKTMPIKSARQDDQTFSEDEFVEVPENYTIVDLGVLSGFKFGIGFAFGVIVVSFFCTIAFGAVLAGLLRELSRSVF